MFKLYINKLEFFYLINNEKKIKIYKFYKYLVLNEGFIHGYLFSPKS